MAEVWSPIQMSRQVMEQLEVVPSRRRLTGVEGLTLMLGSAGIGSSGSTGLSKKLHGSSSFVEDSDIKRTILDLISLIQNIQFQLSCNLF